MNVQLPVGLRAYTQGRFYTVAHDGKWRESSGPQEDAREPSNPRHRTSMGRPKPRRR